MRPFPSILVLHAVWKKVKIHIVRWLKAWSCAIDALTVAWVSVRRAYPLKYGDARQLHIFCSYQQLRSASLTVFTFLKGQGARSTTRIQNNGATWHQEEKCGSERVVLAKGHGQSMAQHEASFKAKESNLRENHVSSREACEWLSHTVEKRLIVTLCYFPVSSIGTHENWGVGKDRSIAENKSGCILDQFWRRTC